jgi:hypothetical protein
MSRRTSSRAGPARDLLVRQQYRPLAGPSTAFLWLLPDGTPLLLRLDRPSALVLYGSQREIQNRASCGRIAAIMR